MQVTTGERGAGRRGKIRGEKSRKTSRECRRVLRCEWLSAAKQRVGVGRGGKKREKRSLQPLGSDGYLRTTGRGDHTVPLTIFSLCSKLIQLFSSLWLALETSGNICA